MKRSNHLRSHISVCLGFGLPFVFLVLWDTFLAWAMVVRFQMNDFAKFYYSTVAFLNNEDMYGPSFGTFQQIGQYFAQNFWNLNPPHFHLLFLPLGTLSPGLALTIWALASFAAFFMGLLWIGKELNLNPTAWQRRFMVLGTLAFSGTGGLLLTGQLSLLLFLPVTLAWLHARQGKWEKAGLSMGLAASIKPFLLIFLPYFVCQRQFKSAGIIMGLTLSSFIIGLTVFGFETHINWIQRLADVDWTWSFMNASIMGMATRTLSENPMYSAIIHADNLSTVFWLTSSIMLGMISLYMTTNDMSSSSIDRSFALLLITALLISPLGWVYYFFFVFGPGTALVTTWWTQNNSEVVWKSLNGRKLRNGLLCFGIAAFLVPPELSLLFQPNAFATSTIGSIFFWGTWFLWLSLFIDWRLENLHIRSTCPWSYGNLLTGFKFDKPTPESNRLSTSGP